MNNNLGGFQLSQSIINRDLLLQAVSSSNSSQPSNHQSNSNAISTNHQFAININHQLQPLNHQSIHHQPNIDHSPIQNHVQAMVSARSIQSNLFPQLNQLTNQLQQTKNDELIWLENFIIHLGPSKSNSPKKYCNACCCEISLSKLNDHLKLNKHFANRKRLNNQLLAINLFQISKHYNEQLTNSLKKSFICYEAVKAVKLMDYFEFEDFLNKNLDIKFKLTLFGSVPNECLIKPSDINVNIEILEEKNEENREILKIIKQLVLDKCQNRFEILKVPNLDRHERAYFMTKNHNLINLINIEHLKQSNLIKRYVEFDSRVKILMFNLRTWANICELDNVLKASYRPILMQIMVIYFLQHCNQPVLPNFHKFLKKNLPVYGENDSKHHQIEPITDEEFNYVKENWQTTNNQNIGELWIDFFKFYLFHFDHEKTYVNIVHYQFKDKLLKAFSVCNVIDGTVFSVIFNWRIHYERMNRLLFDIYKHSCFFPYPNVNTDNLDLYLQFIFSLENFKRDHDFRLTIPDKKEDRKNHNQKFNQQFDLKQLWELSIKFNFKVCIKQKLEKIKKPTFNIQINKAVAYPKLPLFCVLCKSKEHFVKECNNMELPELMPLDKERAHKCALAVNLISDYYYKAKSINENQDISQIIQQVRINLNKSIQTIYPNANLELYGSVLNGFGHIESDLDFALLFNPNDSNNIEMDKRAVVKKIGNSTFKKCKEIKDLLIITHARVPIIRFKYITQARAFECDISIENRLVFCNTHLLRNYCTIDSRVPRLGLLVKKFAKICQICDASRGGLKSYAFGIMLIHFLQQCDPPLLPVLHELEPDKQYSEMVDDWEVKFFRDLDRVADVWPGYKQNKKSVGELFNEFFIFYTEIFNFDKDVVTIKQSSKLTKFEKHWTSKIAIEDPFCLTHNLSEVLEISMVNYIKSSFILARNHFTNFAKRGFNSSMRIEDLFNVIFNEHYLKSVSLLPFGKGCQYCYKIGHKKANCPERRANGNNLNYQLKFEEQFPTDFHLTLNDIIQSNQNLQYLSLIENFDNILKFRH